jgi:NADH:ubiquinone oxidoreductase subunit F (NADH-binding)/NADH:ubiquinone oxidoreductase subunit E
MILQELRAIQDRCGYLPADELRALSVRQTIPLHRLHEVASFYPAFRLRPPPDLEIKVCRDLACHLRGAAGLQQWLEARILNVDAQAIRVCGVSCLGQCDRPIAVSINDKVYHGLTETDQTGHIRTALDGGPLAEPRADRGPLGWRIDPYDGQPDYDALRGFLADRDGGRILRALEVASLRGMGGAGFPTFRKWAAVRSAPGDVKYVICNADESEPGTFKDRELLRRTPHLVIEGLVLAALVTGARQGWIYIRHEYHEERQAVEEALREAQDLLNNLPLELAVFESPGGYIQGEESALLEAMEDRRGEPRNKPPFPVTHGLWGKPTLINNVETLAWVPAIVLRGGEWYRDQGVNGATGLRFVSVSGDVNRPGVYEVPFGQTVRDLIYNTAGGVRGGQALQAVATSGPSGGFLPARIPFELLPAKFVEARRVPQGQSYDILDLPLDFASLGELGGMLGGAFVVYGAEADMIDQALNCVEFFRNESCGKCVPCRLGSQQLVGIIGELSAGPARQEQLDLIRDLAETMQLTSICGLGQVAANPITSLLKYFPEELRRAVS